MNFEQLDANKHTKKKTLSGSQRTAPVRTFENAMKKKKYKKKRTRVTNYIYFFCAIDKRWNLEAFMVWK